MVRQMMALREPATNPGVEACIRHLTRQPQGFP
jgi:hypothetical protein